jgi:hypothetical protein
MFSLVCPSDSPSDSPSGGSWTVPRTVSWTALREDPRTRTALWEDPRTAPQEKGQTYNVPTGLHTYVVSYPAGIRRPELVPTGTQTAFRLYQTISWEGERKPDHTWHFYVREE